ncbi:MAG: penicillin-binding transpeptidase domain-containing protein [Verrucomicrobiota bacterium]
MATSDTNLADRSGNLVESFKSYDPRIILFYGIIGLLLLILAGGLAYQQLVKVDEYADRERQQNQRRVLFPGPRGNIFDRNGKLLVGNAHRFSVLLHLDELRSELRREETRIYKNFVAAGGKKEVPSSTQLGQIARVSLVQRYLDQVNSILGRDEKVNVKELRRHFQNHLLLPYTLLDKLEPTEYARLIEGLPVNSPLEVFATHVRTYPYGSAAAHTLGFVRPDNDVSAEDFEGEDLTTFKADGTIGKAGLEYQFNEHLQGKAGGRIYRVDPLGYKTSKPLEERKPTQGKHLTTSIDIDLQKIAEETIGDRQGAAIALDVNTGEVLVMASKPDYDLNQFSPRATTAVVEQMNEQGAWTNIALNGSWPPGSTFKILTSIAGFHRGILTADQPIENCNHYLRVGNALKPCYNGKEAHGDVLLPEAIASSCDIYYYRLGLMLTPDVLAAEARRMHFGVRTGIELPNETGLINVPDTAWMRRVHNSPWYDGETTNVAIGQGALQVSPLQMACFAASVARNEIFTKPTLLHDPNRPPQRNGAIGLTTEQRAALLEGMIGCTTHGTGKTLTQVAAYRIPYAIAAKTGTAQVTGRKNVAWFICFAPAEKPEIAIAVAIMGENAGEEYGGGREAAPVAGYIMKSYFDKKYGPQPIPPRPASLKTE